MFSLFKRKSQHDKNLLHMKEIRDRIIVRAVNSMMHEGIIAGNHDDSMQDINPSGSGRFGLDVTNPIPVYGIDNIPAYMDQLRYKYVSQSGKVIYNPVTHVRTSASDNLAVGEARPSGSPVTSATHSPNIKGHIDVYNLFSISNTLVARVYVNCYSLKTSNEVPVGFTHRDQVSVEQDAAVVLEMLRLRK